MVGIQVYVILSWRSRNSNKVQLETKYLKIELLLFLVKHQYIIKTIYVKHVTTTALLGKTFTTRTCVRHSGTPVPQ